MHILYIGTLPPHPGGSAVVAGQVLPSLAARGHRVTAVSGTTDPASSREALDRLALPGVRTHRYPIPENVTDTSRMTLDILQRERPAYRTALRRALADGRPDVVLSGRATFAIESSIAARALRAPFVQVEHSRRSGAMAARDGAYVAALTRSFRRADLSILVAENLRDVYTGNGAVVVTNGVEGDLFRPRPRDPVLAATLGIGPDAVVVLHASNLKPLKRAGDIVAAMPAVCARVPTARLVILGDGSDRPALAAAVSASGLDAVVSFVDWQPRERMPDWYALADIVVMASTTEAMSMAGLETMACGRVLIATDIPAFRETVADGIDGLLFPVGDVPALADRIVAAASDASLRARIGAAARERALGWSIDRLVTGWEAALLHATRDLVPRDPPRRMPRGRAAVPVMSRRADPPTAGPSPGSAPRASLADARSGRGPAASPLDHAP